MNTKGEIGKSSDRRGSAGSKWMRDALAFPIAAAQFEKEDVNDNSKSGTRLPPTLSLAVHSTSASPINGEG